MATQADVRRICLALPGTVEAEERFAFSVLDRKGKPKGYVWVWMERIDPKKPRVPQPRVAAIRTASLDDKELLLKANPRAFFTEPHYNGYPAILVRLADATVGELRPLIREAWASITGSSATSPSAAPSRRRTTGKRRKESR